MIASKGRLLKVSGVDGKIACAIVQTRYLMRHCLRQRITTSPVLNSWASVIDYLHLDMSAMPIERFRVLHLDGRNMLIRDEVASEGTVDCARVYVREIIHRALDVGSSRLVLAHNHPSGNPTPSESDIALTRSIAGAGHGVDIRVLDHVIIGASGYYSMREHNQI